MIHTVSLGLGSEFVYHGHGETTHNHIELFTVPTHWKSVKKVFDIGDQRKKPVYNIMCGIVLPWDSCLLYSLYTLSMILSTVLLFSGRSRLEMSWSSLNLQLKIFSVGIVGILTQELTYNKLEIPNDAYTTLSQNLWWTVQHSVQCMASRLVDVGK